MKLFKIWLIESLQLFNVWNFPNRDKRYGLDFKGAIPGQCKGARHFHHQYDTCRIGEI